MVLDSLPELFFTSYLLASSVEKLDIQVLSLSLSLTTSGLAVAFMVAELGQDIDASASFRKKRE